MSETIRQHLINPEACIRCGACERACPNHAISHDHRNMAVDAGLCNGSLKCLAECSTGAIDSWRLVSADRVYSVEEQFSWNELPPESGAA